MANHTSYTAAKRREVAAARAALSLAADQAAAALPLEDYLAFAATTDLAATVDPAAFREFHTARHAALVAQHTA